MKKDSSDNPPRFTNNEYVFHVNETSVTGEKVGQMEIEDLDEIDRGVPHIFILFGPGSDL